MVNPKITISLAKRVLYFIHLKKNPSRLHALLMVTYRELKLVNCSFTKWKWTYLILNLEVELRSIWVLWRNGLQECKDNFFGRSWTGRVMFFIWVLNFSCCFLKGCPKVASWDPNLILAEIPPLNVHRGRIKVSHILCSLAPTWDQRYASKIGD